MAVDLRPIKDVITKRLLVSQSAQLFDPLGWLAPVIIVAKIFIQELWKLNFSWDDTLPEEARHRWIKYYKDLPRLSATKVATVQTVPLPRLELCASVLLSRLVAHLQIQLRFNAALHLWSDSMNTLHWISAVPTRWMTYVANRVSEIQTIVPSAIWHHVPGANNAADCASRGLSACELSQFSLWWNGPPWLKRQEEWPSSLLGPPENTVAKEERRVTVNVAVRVNEPCDLPSRYSSLDKLLRISKTSTLIKLTPLFDGQLLCVRGRLKHSLLTYDEKHPLILPPESILTTLIIHDCYLRCLHGGVQRTLGTLRQSYWILRGRNLVRSLIHRCIPCVRNRGNTQQQLMSDLSSIRITPSERAFMNTGVDYAGPINVRTSKGRVHHSHKAWICIFVCCASRSVHLELVFVERCLVTMV
ncbi:uncharacterized protein LOC117177549 [Belonocnema kinseyi]|uniref:uncharacterized protein LOC117177549 n=1 Tax=Belonocnema kinseyi TaxID=2817044 RepID=UPI00143DE4CA|nr:uncharacterized protein LOC117177549 [Belonocnema kinseyi]